MRFTTSPVRRRFLEFLISVALVHVIAVALYYGTDVAHATAARQRLFAWLWMGATVAVVFVGLQRLKRARVAARAARAARSLSSPPEPASRHARP
ncbi:MAG TPA: hypothetical protein VKH19_12650 [Gemmatimonadaceae bacterium]|nr:hypothetical protein [Gemmatimonadaceae bacterium]